jgi:hypothetical protein
LEGLEGSPNFRADHQPGAHRRHLTTFKAAITGGTGTYRDAGCYVLVHEQSNTEADSALFIENLRR